jgi:hypothetical protein
VSTELEPLLAELSLTGPVEPFLVLADWLQIRGDPWGELIAMQCQRTTDDRQKRTLSLASFSILQRVADTLCPHDPVVGIAWQRGFVSVIAFGDSHGPSWFGDELARLFANPVTQLCRELSFAGAHIDDAYVQPILRFKSRLDRIPQLDFERNWFSSPTVMALRQAFPHAQVGNQRGDQGDSPGFGNSWAERDPGGSHG